MWHLVFNVYWLWLLGGVVERKLGSLKWLAFVLAAAFVGSAFLFGLMGRSREDVPQFAEVLGDNIAPLFFTWLVACLIATEVGTAQIGNAAHISGLLFGVLVAEWRIRRFGRSPLPGPASPEGESSG